MPKTMSRYIALGLVLACSGVGWAGINEKLMAAAVNGNLAKVQSLLGRGADVNAKDNEGDTALMGAARAGSQDIIQALIQAGAVVNAKNRSGETALIQAACNGMVTQLIGAGADVNAKSNDGSTALSNAVQCNHKDKVQLLIRAKANVNAKNNKGETALMFATAQGYMEIAQGLIAAGADVNAKDSEGKTVLMYAVNAMAQMLVKAGANVNAKRSDGWTALMMSASWGNTDKVQSLIQAGADVNMKDNVGETASDLVCRKAEELKKLEGADKSMICPKDAILAALTAAPAIEQKADNAATIVDLTRSMDIMRRADHPTTNETLRCNTPKHLVIIDLVNGELRYRAWNKPRSVMEKPDMEIDRGGETDCEGTGVCATCQYSFKNGPTTYTASEAPGCSDGSEAMMYGWLKVEQDGKTISSWSCR